MTAPTHIHATPGHQSGAASLVMALVLLALVTMVSLYTARTIYLEQKISANDFRTRQAFEAAESGLNTAIAYISSSGGADKNDDGNLDPVFNPDNNGVGRSPTATFGDNSSVTVTVSGAFPEYSLTAVGVSDDRTATRTVNMLSSLVDALPNSPANPLTTRGAIVINGSATIYNPEGHSTIWSGGDVDLGSNNATATNIASSTDPAYPGCMDTSMTCDTVQSSNKVAVGLDVIEHDANLTHLSAAEMFVNFFGTSMANYRASRVTLEVAPANVNNLASNDAAPGVDLATGEVIWIEGDAAISGVTMGCAVSVSGNNTCPTASLDPSILIINGNLTTSGTPQFYGLVFVTGDIIVGSNTTVQGAVIGAGDISNTSGSLDIWYNSDVLNSTPDNGPSGGSPGSWRDW